MKAGNLSHPLFVWAQEVLGRSKGNLLLWTEEPCVELQVSKAALARALRFAAALITALEGEGFKVKVGNGFREQTVGLAIPGMSHYIATKMGIIGFMRGLANDVAGDGITANAVLPGITNTPAIAPQSEEQKRATWEQQAIKRLGEPEDVTGAILFLTSDDAAFITGQANCRRRRSVSDRLNGRRREERKLVQGGSYTPDVAGLVAKTLGNSQRVLVVQILTSGSKKGMIGMPRPSPISDASISPAARFAASARIQIRILPPPHGETRD